MYEQLGAAVVTLILAIAAYIKNKSVDKDNAALSKEISSQTKLMQREKIIKQKMLHLQTERAAIMDAVNIMILDTNIHILRNTRIVGAELPDDDIEEKTDELRKRFYENRDQFIEVNREYELLLEIKEEESTTNGKKE